MRSSMIIDGVALARYLEKCGVSKTEFLSALNNGDVSYERDDETKQLEFIQNIDDMMVDSDLFKKGAKLNFEMSRKFINFLGAHDASEIIDWEAMNIERPNFSKFQVEGLSRLLVALGTVRNSTNAYQSQAV